MDRETTEVPMDGLLLPTLVLALFSLVALVAGVESRDGFETTDSEPSLGR